MKICLICLLFLTSCASIRKAQEEKRDQKAFNRVASSEGMSRQIFKMVLTADPITGEVKYVKGEETIRYDSIPYEVPKYIKESCPELNKDSVRKIYTHIVYKNRVDTAHVVDSTYKYLLKMEQFKTAYSNGRIAELQRQIEQDEKLIRKKTMWIYIISIASGIVTLLLLYLWIRASLSKVIKPKVT